MPNVADAFSSWLTNLVSCNYYDDDGDVDDHDDDDDDDDDDNGDNDDDDDDDEDDDDFKTFRSQKLGKGPQCTINCAQARFRDNCTLYCPEKCVGLCNTTVAKCSMCTTGLKTPYCRDPCDEGTYGSQCKQNCSSRCRDRKCDPVTGECMGCINGYVGRWCNAKCISGFYGPDCSLPCPETCAEQLCEIETGTCVKCRPGYVGLFCDQLCERGKYGPGCSTKCPSKCRWPCDPVSGECVLCLSGYRGAMCSNPCRMGTYGVNCNVTCPVGCLKQSCHHITGDCTNCKESFYGPRCSKFRLNKMRPFAMILFALLSMLAPVALLSVVIICYRNNKTAQRRAILEAIEIEEAHSDRKETLALRSKDERQILKKNNNVLLQDVHQKLSANGPAAPLYQAYGTEATSRPTPVARQPTTIKCTASFEELVDTPENDAAVSPCALSAMPDHQTDTDNSVLPENKADRSISTDKNTDQNIDCEKVANLAGACRDSYGSLDISDIKHDDSDISKREVSGSDIVLLDITTALEEIEQCGLKTQAQKALSEKKKKYLPELDFTSTFANEKTSKDNNVPLYPLASQRVENSQLFAMVTGNIVGLPLHDGEEDRASILLAHDLESKKSVLKEKEKTGEDTSAMDSLVHLLGPIVESETSLDTSKGTSEQRIQTKWPNVPPSHGRTNIICNTHKSNERILFEKIDTFKERQDVHSIFAQPHSSLSESGHIPTKPYFKQIDLRQTLSSPPPSKFLSSSQLPSQFHNEQAHPQQFMRLPIDISRHTLRTPSVQSQPSDVLSPVDSSQQPSESYSVDQSFIPDLNVSTTVNARPKTSSMHEIQQKTFKVNVVQSSTSEDEHNTGRTGREKYPQLHPERMLTNSRETGQSVRSSGPHVPTAQDQRPKKSKRPQSTSPGLVRCSTTRQQVSSEAKPEQSQNPLPTPPPQGRTILRPVRKSSHSQQSSSPNIKD
ncbi:scavenger receptor class f member 1 [Plakobranchus ocellatus]|uniref:Scavenger receptor class f member 1 n=1 Tax=Plakobranchus ocellatus TaxID=259542 RepID=A0AAV4B280_9GAST|nr:scavenger receptor class f member 1 [Plakobranchus ocellatus]